MSTQGEDLMQWKLNVMKRLNDPTRKAPLVAINAGEALDLILDVVNACPVFLRVDLADAVVTNDLPVGRTQLVDATPFGAGPVPSDPVHHPAHYTQGAVECIDAIAAALGPEGFIAFLRGQVIKYQWRLLAKEHPTQDAKKAAWYLDRLVKALEETKGP